jgi:hypothetical protein
MYPQTLIFFTICANYNEQHNGGWKSSINLKLVIFTILCSKCLTSICNKLLNFLIFSKVQIGLESKFCKLYFVSYAQVQQRSNSWLKLSFSKYGQIFFKYITWSSVFFAKLILTETGRHPKVIFQMDVVNNLSTKLPKNLGWRIVSFCCPELFIVIQPRAVHCHSATKWPGRHLGVNTKFTVHGVLSWPECGYCSENGFEFRGTWTVWSSCWRTESPSIALRQELKQSGAITLCAVASISGSGIPTKNWLLLLML